MAGGKRVKALVFALAFFAALLVVGLASVKSSNYKDVGQLKAYMEPVSGINVQGYTVLLQPGVYRLIIGDTVFEFTITQPAPYAVAARAYGPRLGSDDSYAFFLLRSSDGGFTVAALFSAKTFQSLYGATPVMEERVVVSGEYNPTMKAVLEKMHGTSAVKLGEYPVLMVDKILEGCHESYEQPSGRIA